MPELEGKTAKMYRGGKICLVGYCLAFLRLKSWSVVIYPLRLPFLGGWGASID